MTKKVIKDEEEVTEEVITEEIAPEEAIEKDEAISIEEDCEGFDEEEE